MLALGMAASVAIFAFVDSALIRPLPYRDPARLVGVYGKLPAFTVLNLSYPDYLDWKRLNTVFTSLDAYEFNGFAVGGADGVEQVAGRSAQVSFNARDRAGIGSRFPTWRRPARRASYA